MLTVVVVLLVVIAIELWGIESKLIKLVEKQQPQLEKADIKEAVQQAIEQVRNDTREARIFADSL